MFVCLLAYLGTFGRETKPVHTVAMMIMMGMVTGMVMVIVLMTTTTTTAVSDAHTYKPCLSRERMLMKGHIYS